MRQSEFGADQLRSLGRRLRELRELRRWSLRRMAKEAGVSVAAIQSIELGGGNPSLLTAVAIAEALGESVDRLIANSRQDTPEAHLGQGSLPDITSELEVPALRPRIAGRLLVLPPRRALDDVGGDAAGFFYVLDGKVRFNFSDGGSEELESGDALHVASGLKARCTNLMMRRSRILFFIDRRELADHQAEFA